MNPALTDLEIIDSWHTNAAAWIKAIKNEEIESRKIVTNMAIVNTILAHKPKKVLDIGCGEGWLTRILSNTNIIVFGIDAISALIDYANKMGPAKFDVCLYENLPNYKFDGKFDCIVCNFSLIGKESTEIVIKTSADLLQKHGKLIIQTIHPTVAYIDSYTEGWRPGSWSGFSESFTRPAPWYFRTIEVWFKLLNKNGFEKINIIEPISPKTEKPVSIIFECSLQP